MYSKVFDDYIAKLREQGDFRNMESETFFHGIALGQTAEIELKPGKVLVVTLEDIGKTDAAGNRDLTFTVNGYRRVVSVKDRQAVTKSVTTSQIHFANKEDDREIGANIPGTVIKILVAEGDEVKQGQPVAILEAMKMETNVLATQDGTVEKIYVKEGDSVKSAQLIARLAE
jgi:pyruvate carboxylase